MLPTRLLLRHGCAWPNPGCRHQHCRGGGTRQGRLGIEEDNPLYNAPRGSATARPPRHTALAVAAAVASAVPVVGVTQVETSIANTEVEGNELSHFDDGGVRVARRWHGGGWCGCRPAGAKREAGGADDARRQPLLAADEECAVHDARAGARPVVTALAAPPGRPTKRVGGQSHIALPPSGSDP